MKEYYSLLLMPDPIFSRQVDKWKQELASVYGKAYSSLSAPAHLSLCSFHLPAGRMSEHIPFLNAFFQQIPALNLVAGDVDFFAETGTLFLTLRNHEVYTRFQNELVSALRKENPAFKRRMSIASKPHITLGRKFPKDELARLSVAFAGISRSEAFQVNRVQLMFENNGKMNVFHSWSLPA